MHHNALYFLCPSFDLLDCLLRKERKNFNFLEVGVKIYSSYMLIYEYGPGTRSQQWIRDDFCSVEFLTFRVLVFLLTELF